MSSIASGASSERTNRWLLIGAIVLALLTGVLVFAALANFGGSDEGTTKTTTAGDARVLVASETIPANTKIKEGMFEEQKLAEDALVPSAASDKTQVIGQVTRFEILKNQQISLSHLAVNDNTDENCLPCVIPDGMVGITLQGNEIALVAGFVRPGDYVDVMGTFSEKRGETDVTRVETVLGHVKVVARGSDESTKPVPPSTANEGEGASGTSSEGRTDVAPKDVKPDPSAGNVTVVLSPEDAQLLAAARKNGDVFLVLLPVGAEPPAELPAPTYYDEFGPLGALPRR